MKTIYITEKPSVAMTYSKVLGVHPKSKTDGYIEDDRYIITWCVGHLVAMSYPEKYDEELKKWELDTLPFLPEKYKYEIIPEVRKQFGIVKKLYNRPDVDHLVLAGDSGREGIYIQALVLQEAGLRKGIDVKVVWIDSQTEDEIKRGIREMKPYSEYRNLADSGYMRAIEDYALGINFSRALSLRYGGFVTEDKSRPVAVGRVMSCVLGMVVKREREIKNFVPVQYYKPVLSITQSGKEIPAQWRAGTGSRLYNEEDLYSPEGFKTRENAEQFIGRLSGDVNVADVSDIIEKKGAPLLYNLAELQSECSKRLKISPDETLEAVQSLYEKKLVTYPRTDARVLTKAVAAEIGGNLQGLMKCPDYKELAEEALAGGRVSGIGNSRYTDDSKVTDHYALIPTGANADKTDRLSERERAVYDLIVRRFLSIFFAPAEYRKVKITLEDTGERFYITGSALNAPGYLKVTGIPEDRGALDPAVLDVKKGMQYHGTHSLATGETKPPKRYTSGSMVLAMESAGKLIEDEELREQIKGSGIGTSATRAETIKKLVKINYLKLDKKTQVLTPDAAGERVYEILYASAPELLNPDMTASWEKGLTAVAEGRVSADDYRKKLEKYIRERTEDIKKTDRGSTIAARIKGVPEVKGIKSTKKRKVEAECWLDVPRDESAKVKELGAWWDGERKSWYVPKGKDPAPFAKWKRDGKPEKKSGKKTYLNVPYDDREKVKELGAWWDKDKKKWYVPAGRDASPFKKWKE